MKKKKKNEDQGIKQFEALNALKPEQVLKALKPEKNQELESMEGLFQKNIRADEFKNEIDEIRKLEEKT